MQNDVSLQDLQQWVQAAATTRGRVSGRLPEGVPELVTSAGALDGAQRLAIYGRAYHARLLESFRAEYPCLEFALGRELFAEFVADYLSHHPPRSFTLFDLGRNFVAHLDATRPRPEEAEGEAGDWPAFITDLARLERAFMDVYDGDGAEDLATLGMQDIQQMPDAELLEARFKCVPCLRLITFSYPVIDFFERYRAGAAPMLPGAAVVHAALNRCDFVVRFHELTADEYQLLSGLADGLGLGEAASRLGAQEQSGVREWVTRWAGWRFFLGGGSA